MKKYISIAILLVAAASAILFVSPSWAQVEATDSQKQMIQQECVSIKASLTQLHTRDALLRVNMGQHYELISTRLISRLNTRLLANSVEAQAFVDVASSYSTNLSLFRASYQDYERGLTALLKIDCQADPGRFYSELLAVRTQRQAVHSSVTEMNVNLEQYRELVDALEMELRNE